MIQPEWINIEHDGSVKLAPNSRVIFARFNHNDGSVNPSSIYHGHWQEYKDFDVFCLWPKDPDVKIWTVEGEGYVRTPIEATHTIHASTRVEAIRAFEELLHNKGVVWTHEITAKLGSTDKE